MDAANHLQQALHAAVARLLRPLFRLLLRHNMSFGAFEEIAKRAYVDVALRDFGIPGKKPSISRAAILSGLTRKEVRRLTSVPSNGPAIDGAQYNRAARVLTVWARDPDFTDAAGQPRRLELQDGPASFAELVRRHTGDMPARAVLDELMRVGAVQCGEDKRVALVARAYVPQRGGVEKLGILGADVADLIATIDHNIEQGAADPRYQRKVMYEGVPIRALTGFRALSAARAQDLLEKLDSWLATHTPTLANDQPDAPCARVGMGVYYFEERLDSDAAKEP
jgi:hypothetical protein